MIWYSVFEPHLLGDSEDGPCQLNFYRAFYSAIVITLLVPYTFLSHADFLLRISSEKCWKWNQILTLSSFTCKSEALERTSWVRLQVPWATLWMHEKTGFLGIELQIVQAHQWSYYIDTQCHGRRTDWLTPCCHVTRLIDNFVN